MLGRVRESQGESGIVRKVKVKFLYRRDIDTQKWDEVIARSTAETLYPYSWYLDAAAANWSALMMDHYRFIMPLIWKRKYGLRYIYQPFYTQQLGVFSQEYVDPAVTDKMLSMLPKRYRFAHLNFNTKNLVGEVEPFRVYDRKNYILDLQHGYNVLYDSFSTNAKRNLKKAAEINPTIVKDVSIEELVAFKKENDVIRRTEKEYKWLIQLLKSIHRNGKDLIYAAKDEGALSAAAFFGFSKNRVIYLVSASSERGKENRSMFKIVDAFIREHAGSMLILDFEGSNIPSVARFFAGFGAKPEIYQSVSFNRLPLFLKRLKNHD